MDRRWMMTLLSDGWTTHSHKQKRNPSVALKWVNTILCAADTRSLHSLTYSSLFQDGSISSSMPVLDLIDAIQPGSIRYDLIKASDLTDDEKLNNAKYEEHKTFLHCSHWTHSSDQNKTKNNSHSQHKGDFFMSDSSVCGFSVGTPSQWRGRSAHACTLFQKIWWRWSRRWWWPCLRVSWLEGWEESKHHGFFANIMMMLVCLTGTQRFTENGKSE